MPERIVATLTGLVLSAIPAGKSEGIKAPKNKKLVERLNEKRAIAEQPNAEQLTPAQSNAEETMVGAAEAEEETPTFQATNPHSTSVMSEFPPFQYTNPPDSEETPPVSPKSHT
ncbi:hypothetical protein E8E13_005707 [Curvularia kusanoi]|uniref:Uncharacterized protein n=1 Tax=Curvularia kusanoi TaxID=90978 RepID=A0A9P4T6T3_CURKU|nr:hypothetical protein E8E13_005707 [Curvularia kusanoi]